MASLLTNISHVRNQLTSLGVVVDEDQPSLTVVDGIPPSWDTFLDVVKGKDEQPNLENCGMITSKEKGKIERKTSSTKEEKLVVMERMNRGLMSLRCKTIYPHNDSIYSG